MWIRVASIFSTFVIVIVIQFTSFGALRGFLARMEIHIGLVSGDRRLGYLPVTVKLLLLSVGLEVTATGAPLVLTRLNRCSLA